MMRHFVRILPLLVLPAFAGCEFGDVTGPGPAMEDAFVQSLDMASLQAVVLERAAQVEVELLPGGLTASVLAVHPSGQSSEERVQGRAIDMTYASGSGSIRLMLGEVDVTFTDQSRFWIGDQEVGVAQFVSQLEVEVLEGYEPPIVAERSLPAVPQAPDAAAFAADDIVLGGDGASRIRMEVDQDNFEMAASQVDGDPDGWLLLLGLRIALRVSDGTTEIEEHQHDYEEIEDFEGRLASVNLSALSVTLDDGTTIRLVDRTEIVDRDDLITSLAGVAEALELGLEVVAWGKGVVESEEPRSLLALKIAFAARDSEEPEPEQEEFEGIVEAADAASSLIVLSDETVVRILDDTEVVAYDDGSPNTVAGVVEALENGLRVVAWGHGVVAGEEPLVLDGVRVVLKAREVEVPQEDFEGYVGSASPADGVFELEDGTVVRIVDRTEVLAYNDDSPSTLEGVVEALEAGFTVVAWGQGEVEGENPLVLEGTRVVFKKRSSEVPMADFEGVVGEVDLQTGTVALVEGPSVRFGDMTEIEGYNDFSPTTLQGLAEQLEAGHIVYIWGGGSLPNDQSDVILADRVVLKSLVEDFEFDATEVDVSAGTVTLECGWVLSVTDGTVIAAADDVSPATLQGAADALAAGDRVRVWGLGYVTGQEPVTLALIELTIRRIPAG